MAGPNVGSAEIQIDYDGKDLPIQAKKFAAIAGRAAGREFTKEFNKRTEDFGKNLGRNLGPTSASVQRLTKSLQKQEHTLKRLTGWWRRMDSTVRLAIGAIAFGAQEIAAFGPALGASLVVLGGALSSLAVAGGVAVTVFSNFGGALDKLPAEVRPAAKAFQDLGGVFSELRRELQISALAKTEKAWKSIGSTVKGLTPNLKKVADALGDVINDFADGIAPGTKGFKTLNTFIGQAADELRKAARVAGTFAQAIGTMFVRSDAQREGFLQWLQDIGDALNDFAESDAFDVWLRHADQVFGAFGNLLEGTAEALGSLVTDRSVKRLEDFLNTLADVMPQLATGLSTLGELDIFGLIAQALKDIGDALAPLAKPLGELFDQINRIVGIAIDQWAEDLGVAAEFAAPLVQAMADALAELDPDTIRAAADAILVLGGALLTFKGIKVGKGALTGLKGLAVGIPAFVTGLLKKGKGGLIAGAISGLISGALTTAGDETNSGWAALGQKGVDTLFGAISGGLLGGPWGALAGAIVALLASVFTDVDNSIDTITEPLLGKKVADKFRESVESFEAGDIGGGIAKWVEATIASVQTQLDGLFSWLGGIFAPVGEMITAPFVAVGQFFSDFWTGVTTTFTTFFSWWTGFWATLFAPVWAVIEPVAAALAAAWQGMVNTVSTVWNGVVTIIQGVWSIITGIISLALQTIAFIWNTAWTAISNVFQAIWNRLAAFLSPIINFISNIIRTVIGAVVNWWSGVWRTVSSVFMSIWNAIQGFFAPKVAAINSTLRNTFNGVSSWWRSLWSGVASFFSSIWSGIESAAQGAINGIIDVLNGLIDTINNVANALSTLSGGAINVSIPNLPKLAAGSIVTGPTRALIGEAGPEAIVPLDRPLSKVDPSVRGLSAIAQGMAAGGTVGNSRSVVISPGAIVINTRATDGLNIARAVLDRIVVDIPS